MSAHFATWQNNTRIAPGIIFKGLIQYSEINIVFQYLFAGIAYPQNRIRLKGNIILFYAT